MKKLFIVICLILSTVEVFPSSIRIESDTVKSPKREKIGKFFSLNRKDSLREYSKITTSADNQPENQNKWSLQWGGFICNDIFWDNRKMTDARDGAICLYPDDIRPDIRGRDINATPSFNFVVMNTRLTLRIQAPDALGAKISGMVEGWFMGISNQDMNGFAMRHAFLKMDWKSTSLLLGQTWHPLFTENCFAHTVAASSGAPFQPFARSPQIRVTQRFGSSQWMIYLNAQRDYLSTGERGASSEYIRHSAIPEMGAQYIFHQKKNGENNKSDEFLVGIGVDYKYLIPRLTTSANLYTRKGVNSGAVVLFGHYDHRFDKDIRMGIKVKALLSQACNEYLMLGGYAVKFYDDNSLNDSIDYRYTGLRNFSSWIDIYTRIRKWEIGLFAGFSKNMGSSTAIQDHSNPKSYFARNPYIDYLYRISVRCKYTIQKLQFAVEPEYTAARYGTGLDSHGKIPADKSHNPNAEIHSVHGLRILLSATLFF